MIMKLTLAQIHDLICTRDEMMFAAPDAPDTPQEKMDEWQDAKEFHLDAMGDDDGAGSGFHFEITDLDGTERAEQLEHFRLAYYRLYQAWTEAERVFHRIWDCR